MLYIQFVCPALAHTTRTCVSNRKEAFNIAVLCCLVPGRCGANGVHKDVSGVDPMMWARPNRTELLGRHLPGMTCNPHISTLQSVYDTSAAPLLLFLRHPVNPLPNNYVVPGARQRTISLQDENVGAFQPPSLFSLAVCVVLLHLYCQERIDGLLVRM